MGERQDHARAGVAGTSSEKSVTVTGSERVDEPLALERAGRVADYLEFGELMCRDALDRGESCGGHFREEYQTTRARQKRRRPLLLRRRLGVPRRDKEPCCTKSRSSTNTSHPTQRSYK